MSVGVFAGGRPPFVVFEERSIEDRTETLKGAGNTIYRSVDYAIISQAGSQNNIEKEAQPWLESLKQNPAMKREWVEEFKRQYVAWKEGHEITPVGTHIRMWSGANKAEADTLINAKVRTVEDLAGANEEVLRIIGIGARSLQQRARTWLETASDTGKAAEELNALRVSSAAQAAQIQNLEKQLNALRLLLPKQPAAAEDILA